MAVPKRKKSRSKTRSRRSSQDVMSAPNLGTCTRCMSPKKPHTVCPVCGYYKNREVIVTESVE